jgi:hypothetical protein
VPRQLRPARRGFETVMAELQPGDGVDRLRHVGPALLRAAHAEDVHHVIAAETAAAGGTRRR